ncbi:MAG: glycosyltransferase family 2 protein [Holophagales bacterium]|nr:glycosyltransferase family 2 protein [Holophagales bacterium]
MAQVLRDTGAGWVYSDAVGHPRIDYRPGSLRDTFDFGPVVAVSVPAAHEAGVEPGLRWGALYDLRLRLSERRPIVRIPEPLYAASLAETRPSSEAQFDYVDPRNRDYQLDMERLATEHLRRIGALLPPRFEAVPRCDEIFPVTASVVIPVRNRERTILDAVGSALSQQAPFPFNILVVDNHSTDGTTEMLRGVRDPRLVHVVPERRDLGIGGCWDEAVFHPRCGRYAVQLDSDDLYLDENVLARIVGELERGPYAMVVASYTMVDFALNEIPPGLVDHREWTRENGRNNALRVNGFGAPRAFDTAVLRRVGFPNVSYGEDYAVALRMSREYEIGRIYESVYLCRRWEGNSDSALPLETQNRYDAYKDWLRTVEIAARQRMTGARP